MPAGHAPAFAKVGPNGRGRVDDNQGVEAICENVDYAADYVLGKLTPAERERYGRHVSSCEACAEELELLSRAARAPEWMSSSPPPLPPEQQPTTVRMAAEAQYQDDLVGVLSLYDPKPRPSGPGERSGPARPVRDAAAPSAADPSVPRAAGTTAERTIGVPPRRPTLRRRRFVQPIPKPALTGLLALLVVAVITVMLSNRVAQTTFTRGTTAWSTAGIALQIEGSSGELLLDHLPSPLVNEHYEVWTLPKHGNKLKLALANLTLNAAGQAGVTLPGAITAEVAVAVYLLPDSDHGNHAPTGHPVAVVYPPR